MKTLFAQKRKILYPSCIVKEKFLKDKEKFIKLVNEFKVHKSTIIFKMNIVKLIDKHPYIDEVIHDIRLFKKLLQGY